MRKKRVAMCSSYKRMNTISARSVATAGKSSTQNTSIGSPRTVPCVRATTRQLRSAHRLARRWSRECTLRKRQSSPTIFRSTIPSSRSPSCFDAEATRQGSPASGTWTEAVSRNGRRSDSSASKTIGLCSTEDTGRSLPIRKRDRRLELAIRRDSQVTELTVPTRSHSQRTGSAPRR